MSHSAIIDLARPIRLPGGEISRLTLRLPPPWPVRGDGGELECLAAMTGISATVLAEIDIVDASKIYVAVQQLHSDARTAGDMLPPTLGLVL